MAGDEHKTAMLLLTVWMEDPASKRFGARLAEISALGKPIKGIKTTASVPALCKQMCDWLESFVAE